MEQLELLGLMMREESESAPVDATVRADLIDLMARILVAVFQAEGGKVDDRTSLQSQDQAGTSGAHGDRLLAAIERETCLWRIDTVAMKRSDPRNALQPRTQTPDDLIPGFFRG